VSAMAVSTVLSHHVAHRARLDCICAEQDPNRHSQTLIDSNMHSQTLIGTNNRCPQDQERGGGRARVQTPTETHRHSQTETGKKRHKQAVRDTTTH